MEMIVVSLIIVGAEHDIEEVARSTSQGAQERHPVRVAPRPVGLHCNLLPIRQNEAGDVDGIGGRMLAAPAARTMIDITAGISAEMRDPRHVLPEMLPRGRT